MKRKYSNQNTNKKKTELRKLVLMQLSKMRKKIQKEHPGMLEGIKEQVNQQRKTSDALVGQDVQISIDKDKNRDAVEKMLNLKSDNPAFEKAVKTILSKKSSET